MGCGGGLKRRERPVLRRPQHGGKACAAKVQTKECNAQGCGCSHVYCVVQPGTHHIKVMHHKLERGGRKHRCKFNYDSQSCEGMCYNNVLELPKETRPAASVDTTHDPYEDPNRHV